MGGVYMIQSKADYLYYIECDRVALRIKRRKPRWFGYEERKYQRLLRKLEYYTNCKHRNPLKYFYRYLLHKASVRYGVRIPINVCGPGLSIAHIGPIIINHKSQYFYPKIRK